MYLVLARLIIPGSNSSQISEQYLENHKKSNQSPPPGNCRIGQGQYIAQKLSLAGGLNVTCRAISGEEVNL